MNMKPSLSRSTAGREWLRNFEEPDASSARLLLNAIQVVSEAQFRTEMKALLAALSDQNPNGWDAAIPVWSLPRNFEPHYLWCEGKHSRAPATPCPRPEMTGSSLIVQNLLGQVASAHRLLNSPMQTEAIDRKVRRLFLVTDNVVSGEEVSRFIRYVRTSPAIRSWNSYQLISVELVTHSIVESRLTDLEAVLPVHFVQLSPTFRDADWSDAEREEVRRFCLKYGGGRADALGWARAESLLVFGHTFGNGVPAVVRLSGRPGGGPWNAIVPKGRNFGMSQRIPERRVAIPISQRIQREVTSGPTVRRRRLPVVVGALRGAMTLKRPIDEDGEITALLAALYMSNQSFISLMRTMSRSRPEVVEMLRRAERLKLISGLDALLRRLATPLSQGQRWLSSDSLPVRLTIQGRHYLLRARRAASRKLAVPVTPADDFYYPQQLR
nr:hypothetical protein [Agrococcus carbonis]